MRKFDICRRRVYNNYTVLDLFEYQVGKIITIKLFHNQSIEHQLKQYCIDNLDLFYTLNNSFEGVTNE